MLVVVRPGSHAVEFLLVGRRHQTVGRLGDDGRRCLTVPGRFLRIGHETVRGILFDHRRRMCGRVLVVVRSGGHTREFRLLLRGVVFGRKALARNLIDLLADLRGDGRSEIRIVAQGGRQLLERIECRRAAVHQFGDGLIHVCLCRFERRAVPALTGGFLRSHGRIGVAVGRLKRRGIALPTLLGLVRHGGVGVGLGRRKGRGIALCPLLGFRCDRCVGIGFRGLEGRRIALFALTGFGSNGGVGIGFGRGERRGIARGQFPADRGLFTFGTFDLVVESAVERLDVILDLIERLLGGGYMDGEVVGYFLHSLLQLPPFGRIVFPVELVGKPLDPAHRDFVLGLMEEAVEEVRELLGRRVHSPAEPFAQLRTYSDCHSVIA